MSNSTEAEMWENGMPFVIPSVSGSALYWLEKFQAGLAGILGFSGVMLTLFLNAHFANRSRLKAAKHEESSIRSALVEDLKYYHDEFAKLIHSIENPSAETSHMRRVRFRKLRLYHGLIEKLGALPPKQTGATIRAYGQIATVMSYMSDQSDPNSGKYYYAFRRERVSELVNPSSYATSEIRSALRDLECKDEPKAAYKGAPFLFRKPHPIGAPQPWDDDPAMQAALDRASWRYIALIGLDKPPDDMFQESDLEADTITYRKFVHRNADDRQKWDFEEAAAFVSMITGFNHETCAKWLHACWPHLERNETSA